MHCYGGFGLENLNRKLIILHLLETQDCNYFVHGIVLFFKKREGKRIGELFGVSEEEDVVITKISHEVNMNHFAVCLVLKWRLSAIFQCTLHQAFPGWILFEKLHFAYGSIIYGS